MFDASNNQLPTVSIGMPVYIQFDETYIIFAIDENKRYMRFYEGLS